MKILKIVFRLIKGKLNIRMLACLIVIHFAYGCGGGGGGDSTHGGGLIDTRAPSASITFPPARSMTDGDTVKIYGTASDNNIIASVRINGITAQTNDGYANWEVAVPLTTGLNTLTVETRDISSNINTRAAEITVQRERYLIDTADIEIDPDHNRALILDQGLRAVIAMDLSTGLCSVISNDFTPDANIHLINPSSLALDAIRNRALLVDQNAVIAVDLNSGARSVLSDNTTPNIDTPFSFAHGIAIDSAHNRALVSDLNLEAVVAVDLDTGARSVLSDNTTPDAENPLKPSDIVIDPANNRALVINNLRYSTARIIAIDLNTGERTVFFDGDVSNGIILSSLLSIALDSVNNRALIAGYFEDRMISVDLTTGEGLLLPDHDTLYSFNYFAQPEGMVVDTTNNRALVTHHGEVLAVDLTSGMRTIISDTTMPDENIPFYYPYSIELDSLNNRVLVTDSYLDSIIAVDLSSGARTSFFDKEPPELYYNVYPHSTGIALNSNDNYVLTAGNSSVVTLDLHTGAKTQSFSVLDSGGSPVDVTSIAIDSSSNRALFTTAYFKKIYSLDPGTGEYSVLSSNTTPDMDTPFSIPWGIDLDLTNNRALVTDNDLNAVIAVDLSTGARTTLSDNSTYDSNNPPFSHPWGISVESKNNRALVSDGNRIIAVDLTSGIRTQISGAYTEGITNPLFNSTDIALEKDSGIAYVTDTRLNAILAVYIKSGERMILSK